MDIDVVILWVDGSDPAWLAQKNACLPPAQKDSASQNRFRDWGLLPYWFRSLEKYAPWVRTVHFVTWGHIPSFLDPKAPKLHIVRHEEFIPQEYLPTFSSHTIEMNIHRIPGLAEHFIYFNDDIFPLLPCKPTDFFRGGKGILGMSHHLLAWDMFKKICRNSDTKAREALGLKPRYCFLRPQHTCQPMLKSEIKSVYDKLEKDILGSMTPTRTEKNLNQYLYLDYMYLNGKIINERQSKKHFSVAWVSASKLRKFIEQPTHKLTCINDVHLSEERYTVLRTTLIEAFERRMPNKSKYEI